MSDTPSFPPKAERRPTLDTRHGIERTDDYAWLRAHNWQEVFKDSSVLDPAIRAHLEAENAYAKSVMGDTEPLRETLIGEMRGRIKEDDSSVPSPDGEWAYGIAYEAGAEYPKFIRRPRDGGEETVLLDAEKEGADRPYFSVGGASHSGDHKLLAWAYDDKGSEYYTLKVRDIESGQDLADVVEDTGGGGVWSARSNGFFYTRLDANHRPSRLFYHRIGDDPAHDALIYEETDAGFFMGVGKTQSDEYVVIDIHDHETSECWLIPASNPAAEPRLIAERETAVEYDVDEGDGILYIRTNVDGAHDFKIVTAPVDAPHRSQWRDLVPHEDGRMIISNMILKRHLIWLERRDGLPRIVVRRLSDGEEHAIAFAEEAYSLGLLGTYEYDTTLVRPPGLRAGQGWRDGADLASLPQGHAARRLRAAASLWLRLLRDHHSGVLQHQLPVIGRSRLRLCHRPYSRRQGQGLPLVRCRTAAQQGEHLHRLHRGGGLSGGGKLYEP